MTTAEKFEILTEHANRTHDEAIEQINKYGKVMVVRPTGFGKTRLLIRLAKEYARKTKKKILYVYPLGIIETEIKGKKEYMSDGLVEKYVDFASYQVLTKRLNEKGQDYWYNYLNEKYSLILLDEVHRAGSDGFLAVYETIKELIGPDKIHMIGVTATPNRMMDTEDQNVTKTIFDEIGVYRFELVDAFREGILQDIILACRQYNMEELAAQLKERQKSDCFKKGVDFDEKVFNIELGKALGEIGGESEYIYKYIKKAGYVLSNPKENYFKFIVFFVDIADMVERGPIVEEWFNGAFNDCAKKDQGLRKEFEIHSHYVASSDTETNDLKQLVSKKSDRRNLYKQTKKLNNIESDSRKVDLLFTVNMINMGYHVENISGIMMLRGTKSEIIYYQQLGRCLSVTADRSPIVYDMVRNKDAKFWYKKDRQREIQNKILGLPSERGEGTDYTDINIFQSGDADEFESFMDRWSDMYYSEKAKIIWLYENRKAPICAIAADTKKSCTEIVEIIIGSGIELRVEDAMYRYIERSATADKDANSIKLLKFIYSKKAQEVYETLKGTVQSLYTNITKILKSKK